MSKSTSTPKAPEASTSFILLFFGLIISPRLSLMSLTQESVWTVVLMIQTATSFLMSLSALVMLLITVIDESQKLSGKKMSLYDLFLFTVLILVVTLPFTAVWVILVFSGSVGNPVIVAPLCTIFMFNIFYTLMYMIESTRKSIILLPYLEKELRTLEALKKDKGDEHP